MYTNEKEHNDYSVALAKLCYLLTRCLNCNLFPCNIFSDDVATNELSGKEYSCLRAIARLLEIVRSRPVNHAILFCELLSRIMPRGLITLERIINLRYVIAKLCLEDEEEASKCVLRSMGLGELIPLIEDEDVEDIYVTGRGIYVVKRGLKIENVEIDRGEILRLARRFLDMSFLAGHDLNFDNPSALYSLNIGNVLRLRVSVDVWPCTDDVVVHVRVHRRPLSLDELAELRLASKPVLKGIVKQVRGGSNLVIVGPPGSGKTTLLNAILLELAYSEHNMRIVCIDEADEIWLPDNVLVLKYRSIYGRVREVEKMLYRGGGILVIGELREREHYEAFNLGLKSGLQVLATIHGKSVEDAVSKFERHGVDYDGMYVVLGIVDSCRRIVHVSVPVGTLFSRLS
ncbi:MAG: type II/IV secretion system ATPase subunit [Crenarchaeota archaeon]|nr:type II/IV secretion system ATPase subunit [Thermoproteota archaeon]